MQRTACIVLRVFPHDFGLVWQEGEDLHDVSESVLAKRFELQAKKIGTVDEIHCTYIDLPSARGRVGAACLHGVHLSGWAEALT